MTKVLIKCSNDKRVNLEVDVDTTTVLQLKDQIAGELEDTPAGSQRLIYAGRILKDGDFLSAYQPQQVCPIWPRCSAAWEEWEAWGGMGGMPGMAGMPGMDGLGGMSPEQMEQMYSNPMVQQMMEQIFSNPEVLRSMIDSNPMLQQQLTPQMREMLNNPDFLRMASNPEFMRAAAQMQSAMRRPQGAGAGAGAGTGAGAGSGLYNPWASTPSSDAGAGAGAGANSGSQPPAFNPFAAFMNPGQQLGALPGAQSGQANQSPPEERFREQLQQLRDMGFVNPVQNIRALSVTDGNVQAAVEFLLSSPDL
ncbi:hypothetical protein BX661DRAFT_173320 [Kickxella alabastrina]|uniref:uncharacterized protein n=1 Tax=Kickxella alabastrina TaxID=61397 RepID=UPI00221E9D27|nr:uncharacterized protein BX661DRAFT_173320 [Kickxella alabastrina]KAI7821436.1 hypothetical protein BX661DRAFT_173320 [Kickxella alabastrina]